MILHANKNVLLCLCSVYYCIMYASGGCLGPEVFGISGRSSKSKMPRSQPVAKAAAVRCAPESQATARSDFTMIS